ncbi:class I SAM-dependent methyltransferase [Humisphaera borealis]|uniref:Class I SAM-dependent methyltransferase n=1 Tax=Humisphaera borealis TaxID=2807512 RepID=A0A7M2WZ06_9BACT|nr:class I SAM-dependent methyltransferase [Humisphaera borealis]QOV90442.1 class I SAM-dependent methyltransferase [Humisphaera borealis]
MKSTVEEIRARFDADVERFSNLQTGQSATVDAPLVLELIAEAASVVTPGAGSLLDVGCGAGNYALKLLSRLPGMHCTLVDLSRPMLDRAVERVSAATTGIVTPVQDDVRSLDLQPGSFDLIAAAAVLHHLRTDAEWEAVFAMFYRVLRPGGSVWISDLVAHDHPGIQAMMWRRYGAYLSELRGGGTAGEKYRQDVFAYVEKEDTPRPLEYQTDLLRRVGFAEVVVLHKNGCFAAFGAVKR